MLIAMLNWFVFNEATWLKCQDVQRVDQGMLLGLTIALRIFPCKITVVLAVSPLQNAANVKETATLMLTAMLNWFAFNEAT